MIAASKGLSSCRRHSPASVATTVTTSGGSMSSSPSSSSTVMMDTTTITTTSRQRELSIYWDFENVPLPNWAKPADASKAIVRAVSQYGRIVDRRLYFDMSASGGASEGGGRGPGGVDRWSALDSSGFDLVNTPRRGNKKETLDKKLIADVLTFAWDSAVRNDDCKPCVVLITSDGDYSYALQKLRDRGVMSVVMYGRDEQVANVLRTSADVTLSFENDVLLLNNNDIGMKSQKIGGGSGGGIIHVQSQNLSDDHLTTAVEDAKILCSSIMKVISKEGGVGGQWLLGSKASAQFRRSILDHENNNMNTKSIIDAYASSNINNREALKRKYQTARDLAITKGWLVMGRRCIYGPNAGNIIPVQPDDGTANDPKLYSPVDFLGLTEGGKKSILLPEGDAKQAAAAPPSMNSSSLKKLMELGAKTKLFIKNVPVGAKIKDVVTYLEQQHQVEVVRGNIQVLPHPNAKFKFAHIQVQQKAQADRLLGLSDTTALMLDGRILTVSYDTRDTDNLFTRDPMQSYERPAASPNSSPPPNRNVLILCQAVQYCWEQQQQGKEVGGWIEGGRIAVTFRNAIENLEQQQTGGSRCLPPPTTSGGEDYKQRFRTTRSRAIDKKYIEVGRRAKKTKKNGMGGGNMIEVCPRNCDTTTQYSMEVYIRLTESGRFLVQSNPAIATTTDFSIGGSSTTNSDDKKKAQQNLYLSSLPPRTDVRDLIRFLETRHNCSVQKALVKHKGTSTSSYCAAHVEFASHQDAEMMLKMSSLSFKGKRIKVMRDLKIPSFVVGHFDPTKYYHCPRPDNVPDTVVARPTIDSCSLFSSESQSQKSSPEDSLAATSIDEMMVFPNCDDTSLICRVIYERAPLSEEHSVKWKETGGVAQEFQKLLMMNATPEEEAKDRFKKSREEVILNGIVEFGRRDLKSISKEIVVAPFPAVPAASSSILSSETYLRLTQQGVRVAEKIPRLKGHVMPNEKCSTQAETQAEKIGSDQPVDDRLNVLQGGPDGKETEAGCTDDKFFKEEPKFEGLNIFGECKSSPLKSDSLDAAKAMPSSEGKTAEMGNLLFGDNLALLYAQTAQMPIKETTEATQEKQNCLQLKTVPQEIPDLLWS